MPFGKGRLMDAEKGCAKYASTTPEELSWAFEFSVTCLRELKQAYKDVFLSTTK